MVMLMIMATSEGQARGLAANFVCMIGQCEMTDGLEGKNR